MRRSMRLDVYAVCALLTALPLAAAEPMPEPESTSRVLEIDDYFAIRDVAEPQFSPDGKWIAYTVTETDLEEDESETRVWMVPAAGGEPIPMTAAGSSASQPRWSPDGQYLSFLAARDEGETQVWTLFRHGGDAQQLTDTVQGVEDYEWSPDGQWLVLVLQDAKPKVVEAKERGEEPEEDDTPEPWVVTRQQFKEDFVGYLDSRRTHLYLFEVASKSLTPLTSGDFDDSEPAWSPDGRLIAFTSNRTQNPDANYNTDIWLVAAGSPDAGGTLRQLTRNEGPDAEPVWSPDGNWIAYRSAIGTEYLDYATFHLAVVPAAGGKESYLTRKLDRWVYEPHFSADSRSLLFLLEDGGENLLARIPVRGGAVERLVGGTKVVLGFSLGPDGTAALLIAEPHLPPEIFLRKSGQLEQLTFTNDEALMGIRLGEMEPIRFASADGTWIGGFVLKPPGFDPSFRYPVLLSLHGGPVAQYDSRFDFESLLYAAHGYVVVLPNPRGSSGYGQAFSLGIWQSWGEKDYEDVMAAVDHVIAQGYGDPDRLGVGGWSYGGMLTNHVITRTDRFKAAVTGASATLYVVNYGHDEYQRWWEGELGLPWKNRDLWEKLSPFNRVEEIVTPTLILCGEKDWNVPVINSEQLFLALKRLGKTAELVVYPGEFHTFETPSYIKDRFERYLAWYGKYVKGESGETATGNAEAGS